MKLEQIEKCIREYGDDIYRFCYFLTGSREAAELVLSVVNDLPEIYRIVVLMYYNGQMTTGQIAEELKISKGTVTSRLMRARDMIKKGLEARGYER